MSRLIHNTIVLARAESSYGTLPAMTGADAVEVFDLKHDPRKISFADVTATRGYRGVDPEIPGLTVSDLSFAVNLTGSGAAGTAPVFSPILKSCGLSETISADTLVEYAPGADGTDASLAVKHYADGVLYPTVGLRGTFDFKATMGDVARLSFSLTGLPSSESAVSNPTPTYTAWKPPVVITDTQASDITLGCAYAAGAISGGSAYPGQGIDFSAGNAVSATHLTSGSEIDITDRKPTGKLTLSLTAAQELALHNQIASGATTSIGYTIGTAAGYTFGIFIKAAQLSNPQSTPVNGRRMMSYDFTATRVAGNDEYVIWFK